MDIEIIGTESLGVRGLCCFVKTRNRQILIDPGVALGYTRHGLMPHPIQIAIGERVQKKIIKKWLQATDIIISHFHGDHTPLTDANPYQLPLKKVIGLKKEIRIWAKDVSHLSKIEKERVESFPSEIRKSLISAEEKKDGPIIFSNPVSHGDPAGHSGTVMMTRIEEGNDIFVHASDIQLLHEEALRKIVSWTPSIVLASGPSLYLPFLSEKQKKDAWHNAKKLTKTVHTLIIDHHLMRSSEGICWLKQLSAETGKKVICAAGFMKRPMLLLEAWRKRLYEEMPVPEDWHEMYAQGKINTDKYWRMAKKLYEKELYFEK